MRQIVLDTETTGLEPSQGHRIIEIGCVELLNRRLTGNHFHQYLQPDREIEAGAIEVHGITNDFLRDKPRFHEVMDDFLDFVRGAELIIHNAPFDLGFLRTEIERAGRSWKDIEGVCSVVDTLALARSLHPGQKNNLDALCKRYEIDNSQRTLHGALLDAEILAEVYLVMSGGQSSLLLDEVAEEVAAIHVPLPGLAERAPLPIVRASAEELARHTTYLAAIERESEGGCVWLRQGFDG